MAYNSTKDDEQTSNVSKTQTLKRLFAYMLPFHKEIVLVLFIMAYCVGISLLNPTLVQTGIDDYISNGDYSGLFRLCIFGFIINILMILLIKARIYVMAKVCNKVLVNIRQELFTHLQTLDFKFFDGRPSGKIISRIIGDINSLKDVLSNAVTTFIPDFITVIAVVVIMFIKNPKLAFAALFTIPFMTAGIIFIQMKSHKRWQIFRKKSSNLNAFIHEDMAGIKIVQAFTAEAETQETFEELGNEHIQSFYGAIRYCDAFSSVIDICWALGNVTLYYAGIKILGVENVSVGTLLAFGTYASMFWSPIMNISNFYNQLVTNIAGAERIFEVLDVPAAIADNAHAIDLEDIEGTVSFRDVSFAYEDEVDGKEPTTVLKHVSFDIKPGETIALVGPTGAGKTTIVNLISRFYDATEGTILIDGHPITEISLSSLRQQMGVMTQDNFLFSDTIRENIRYGRLDATDEEIINAAKAVNAHEFIMKMKDGYDTVLSERGGGLSAGQKQLIAFARTMVSMPKILILDEATSSIDTKTELLVQNGIENLLRGRTSFVIAHRLSTIQKADRIFVVDDGRIIEEGNAKELLAAKGFYYNLYMAQFKEVG